MSAVLIMREEPGASSDPSRMEELEGLAEAAGYSVLDKIVQRKGRDHRFQVGRGKIVQAMACNPRKLIFYNPLSPDQIRSLKNEFKIDAIDRFNLILEIFAKRASTREAKLQVELARLAYEAPVVKNAVSASKLTERPGYKSAGSYEESMYRDILRRSAKIRSELLDVVGMGRARRARRREQGFDLVALAGYTNAGKSTLLNALSDSAVAVKDQPFTTLTPTTRAVELSGDRILLTDTVGFIDDLPHFLIKSFRSTLSEISEADLILLVADLSDKPEVLRKKLAASHKAIWDCTDGGSTSVPMITVLNKADMCAPSEADDRMNAISDLAERPICVSAESGFGLDGLQAAIKQALGPRTEASIILPGNPDGLKALSTLYEKAELLEVTYGEEIMVRLKGREEVIERMRAFCGEIRLS
jgi:GTP-binding protein HflX